MSSLRATRSRARKPSTTSLSPAPSKPVSETTAKPRAKSTSQSQGPLLSRRKSTRGKAQQTKDVWCICRGPDDRTPMIRCEHCKDWFHFACIDLSERDAEDIQLYICSACHDKTGQSTVYEWEGTDAVEEYPGCAAETTSGNKPEGGEGVVLIDPGDEDEDDEVEMEEASEDDYKEEEQPGSVGVRRGRGTQIIASSDDEDVSLDEEPLRRAPSRRSQLKRKRERDSHLVSRKRPRKPSSELGADKEDVDNKQNSPSHRKVKKEKYDAPLDPMRKYCSEKLREVLLPIFVQFASTQEAEAGSPTDFDQEKKKKAEEDGAVYVQDLERCLFETYGEIDKRGSKTTAGKYKDRFRMLSFNLSQPDRHLLRRNIGTHALSASQLSKMSSVELANEQTKLQIEAANRESLQHSILVQRPIAARAKITHKGEEVIEDLVGDDVGRRIRDEEQRETEREREREKDARERVKMLPPPPKEKVAYRGPQDILAQQHNAASQKAAQAQAQAQAQRPPGPNASPSSVEPPEPTFKLDDLIAIDLPEGSPSQEGAISEPDVHTMPSTSSSSDIQADAPLPPISSPPSSSKPRSASFDLNNVWSGSPPENPPVARSGSPMPSRTDETREGPAIDIDLGTAADDEDFDIFLDRAEATVAAPGPSRPEQGQAAFEALPIVWNGHLNLPDAGKAPAVQARQVGGPSIDVSSSQWHILFPSQPASHLKIDGRVPVKDSAKYMTQNRLNVTRELVVVALTPCSDRTDFDEIVSFLVNRDRHAVIHPWGPNPSPEAPGKELYLIPIMPDEPLPDYVEILDLVKFPKQRDDKILLGVFVLNKGKFTEHVPSRAVHHPTSVPVAVPPIIPTVEAPAGGAPLQTNSPAASIPQEIVSKLTPQQVESLLQTVLSGGLSALPLSQPQPQQSPPPATFPPGFPASLVNLLPQQQQQNPAITYPQYDPTGITPVQHQYPPPAPQRSPPMPYNYPNLTSSPPLDHDYRGSPPYGNDHPRPGEYGSRRGARGNSRNFSSERGRSRDFDRPRDSGWGSRGRGRGRTQQSPSRPW